MSVITLPEPDEKLPYKIAKKTLRTIQGLLVIIGKPLYVILISIFLLLIYSYYGLMKLISKFISRKGSLVTLRVLDTTNFLTIKLGNFVSTEFKKFLLHLKLIFLKQTLNPRLKKFRKIVANISILTVAIIFTSTLFWSVFLEDLPSPKELSSLPNEVSTKIYDRNGILLYKIYKDKNRTPVKLRDLPEYIKLATIAYEDAEFYTHQGFSFRGILRALINNTLRGEMTGGSTITQQLVKNTLLSSEKTFYRKVRELILAVEVELYYGKDEILEMYLNEVSYGGTAYGIQEAAKVYFGKSAKDLTLAEAALLAGLPKSPTKYSPFGSNPKLAFARQKDVLHLMVENLFVTKEEEEKALKEEIKFAPNETNILAPHFVMYIRELLEDRYGKELVEKGGLNVVTTLDYQIQKMAEEVVQDEVVKLKNYQVTNGAALVVSPKTGEILAMVGSKDYYDTRNDGNVNILTSLQQPGSSIKVVNYSYALSHGYTPSTIINDSPVTYNIKGSPPYSPKNYDGAFKGNLTLRNAFAQSRNVPAVKVLASYGVDKMIEQGKLMGITTWTEPWKYGLSITLGGADIKPIDLAQVYSDIANYGSKVNLNPIINITNFKETVIEKNDFNKGTPVLDPRVAYLITDILKDNNARSPAFGVNSLLNIQGHKEVAVKTGTSNSLRDNFAIGYNRDYLTLTWVGNNDNSPMARIASGITGATPIFNSIMTNLLKDKASTDWEIPQGLEKVTLCYSYKKEDSEETVTKKYQEWFLKENVPKNTCSPIANTGTN